MITDMKLTTLLHNISHGDPFTFSRWGDGEWKSVLVRHKPGAHNCDSHEFFPEMGNQLRRLLIDKPEYLLGMQNFAMRLYGTAITNFLEQHKLASLNWINADVFHYGAIYGQLQAIVNAVKKRKLVIVGPYHLKALDKSGLPYWRFIAVPPRNNFLALRETFSQIVSVAESQKESLLISLSASMPAEILCDMLFKRFGDKHTIIDFGSLWDPLVGKLSRSYMKVKK